MGKRLYFNHEARRLLQAGVDELANTVKVTLGPEGPQRRARAPDRGADDHQRRRLDRARDRALRPVQEHGRAARARGRQQDERPHRRRHDDGDAARPGDRARGHARARRGRQPDAAAPRHRGGDRAASSAELQRIARPVRGPRRAAPRRDDRRQGGRGHRRGGRRGARPRRRRGRRHDRGVRRARHLASSSSRACSSRTAGSRPTWSRDRERMETVFENPLHPHDQQADLAPEGPPARARRRS